MPAAAVIPAPIAYIKVVAVKKLVVGSRAPAGGAPFAVSTCLYSGPALPVRRPCPWLGCGLATGTFTLKKLECSKQATSLNNAAWNNGIGPRFYFVGFRDPR